MVTVTAWVTKQLSRGLAGRNAPLLYFLDRPVVRAKSVALTVSAIVGLATLLPLLPPSFNLVDAPPLYLERFHKLAVGAFCGFLAASLARPAWLRSFLTLVSISNLGAFALSAVLTLFTFRPDLPGALAVLAVAVLVSIVMVVYELLSLCLWASRRDDVDRELGRPLTPMVALSSCVATFLCFTWLFLVPIYGVLQLGYVPFLLAYMTSTALGISLVVFLRERMADRSVSLTTPFQVFEGSSADRPIVWLAAVVVIGTLYGLLGYLELRLFYSAVAALSGPLWATLALGLLVGTVLYYLNKAGFWGSTRTDALQLAHIVSLTLLIGALLLWIGKRGDISVGGFFSPPGTNGGGSPSWDHIRWILTANLVAGHACSVFGMPDTWSRFALALPDKTVRRFGLYAFLALSATAAISGAFVRALLGSAQVLVGPTDLGAALVIERAAEAVRALSVSGPADALWFCTFTVVGGVILLTVMATLDTAVSSWHQGWKIMGRGPTSRLQWGVALVLTVSFVSAWVMAAFPLLFIGAFTFAAALASMPMWVVRLGAFTTGFLTQAVDRASIFAITSCWVAGLYLAVSRIVGSPQSRFEEQIAIFGMFAVFVLLVSALLAQVGYRWILATVTRTWQGSGD